MYAYNKVTRLRILGNGDVNGHFYIGDGEEMLPS